MSDPKLTKISGVGPATARILAESGFASVEAVAGATEQQLAKVPGFGEARAAAVITAATSVLSADETTFKKDKRPKNKKKKKRRDRKAKDKKSKKKNGQQKKKKKGKKGKKKDGKKKRKK